MIMESISVLNDLLPTAPDVQRYSLAARSVVMLQPMRPLKKSLN
jgi:hypothetical protein